MSSGRILIGIFIVSSIWFSCSKTGQIGLNTQPVGDQIAIAWKDTQAVISYTYPDDSLPTSNSPLMMIGSYVDPIFGKTTASVFTQLSLQYNGNSIDFTGGIGNFNQPNYDLVLDSVILCLQYTTTSSDGREYYGNLDPQTFNVYRISPNQPSLGSSGQYPTWNYDSVYYSGHHLTYDTLLGSKTFVPSPDSNITEATTIYPYFEYLPPMVRIKLNTGYFLRNIFSLGPNNANLQGSANFQVIFPGLYITPANNHPVQANGKGGILYFSTYGAYTKLMFYYRRHVSAPAAGDTLQYAFEIDGASAEFNYFQHDYSGTPVAKRLTPLKDSVSQVVQNPSLGIKDTDFTYIQAMGGLRTLVLFPHLTNWAANGPVAINRAELLVKVDAPTITSTFDAPPQLYLVPIDSNSYRTYYFPIDFSSATSNYGGTYNPSTYEYSFNIPQHIQAILDGKLQNRGFWLLASSSTYNAQRVVLYGASRNKLTNKMRLRLTYTNLSTGITARKSFPVHSYTSHPTQ